MTLISTWKHQFSNTTAICHIYHYKTDYYGVYSSEDLAAVFILQDGLLLCVTAANFACVWNATAAVTQVLSSNSKAFFSAMSPGLLYYQDNTREKKRLTEATEANSPLLV